MMKVCDIVIIFKDDFCNSDDRNQSYSVIPERTHKYTTSDTEVKSNKFCIKRAHAKQLLLMPATDEFSLSVDLSYHGPAELTWRKDMGWGIFFGYDKKKRTGYKLIIKYKESKKIVGLILCVVDGVNEYELKKEILENVIMPSDTEMRVEITTENEYVKVFMLEKTICFNAEFKRGIIAFSKECGVCETCFSNVVVWGNESHLNWKCQ